MLLMNVIMMKVVIIMLARAMVVMIIMKRFLVEYHATHKVADSYSQAVRPTSLAQQRR